MVFYRRNIPALQRGGGGKHFTPYHAGKYMQRGGGLGALFGRLFKSISPLFKAGVKSAARLGSKALKSDAAKGLAKVAKESAVETGTNLLKNLIKGEDVKEGIKNDIIKARKRVTKSVKESLSKRQKKNPLPPPPPKTANKKTKSSHTKTVHKTVRKKKLAAAVINDSDGTLLNY